jgi:hypothetical protein
MSRWQTRLVLVISGVLVAVIVVAGIVLLMPRTPNLIDTQHPSPALVVEAYLTALADGDAEAALAIDTLDPKAPPYLHADRESFMTNQVLGSALERISKIETKVTSADDQVATVDGSFFLAGETYQYTFHLEWNEQTWVIGGSMASQFLVYSYTDNADDYQFLDRVTLPFTLAGTAPSALAGDGADNVLGYIAYPGVYELVVDMDEATLADAEATPLVRQLVVPPYGSDWRGTIAFPTLAG